MGKVIIQGHTTEFPIQLMGQEAGICVDADVTSAEKNYKRGIDCIKSEHGRVMEYPQVYMELDGYSARVIREFYTHIGGGPSRLQASSRYIDYESGFKFVTPPTIASNPDAKIIYEDVMTDITRAMQRLERLNVPREDIAMLLPLGMETKVIVRTNFRNLVDMSHQRMCARAYWEFRHLFKDIYDALYDYSEEWKWLVSECFMPKCEYFGYCKETKSCGKMPKKDERFYA